MRHYFAGFIESNIWKHWDEWCPIPYQDVVKQLFILGSYFYIGKSMISKARGFDYSLPKDYMVDSGAFTFIDAQKKGKNIQSVDWFSYAKEYGEWLKDHPMINHFFEIDIDQILPDGYKGTIPLRDALENIVGKPCIPVYHLTRTFDDWHEICEKYKYVAIGNMGNKGNDIVLLSKLVDIAHSHGSRIHGLGRTSQKIIEQVPFDSVDSTSYLSCARFGTYYSFDNANNQLEKYKLSTEMDPWPPVKPKILAILQNMPYAKYCESLPSTWDGSSTDLTINH